MLLSSLSFPNNSAGSPCWTCSSQRLLLTESLLLEHWFSGSIFLFLQLRDRHLLCNGSVRFLSLIRVDVFSSAILRASGDTFIFRISAVLAGVLLIFFGWLQWDSFFLFFCI
jgi:hypothetical protein